MLIAKQPHRVLAAFFVGHLEKTVVRLNVWEWQIVRGYTDGDTAIRDIVCRLDIIVNPVSTHMHRVTKELGAPNCVESIRICGEL